jgi:hypothetical protein
MISVRCPACEKVVGFEEADGGSLVACPYCREPFFVPTVAQPLAAEAAPAPAAGPAPPKTPPPIVARLPQAPTLPDDLRIVDDPDLEPIPELLNELLPVEDEAPPPVPEAPALESPPEPQPAPEPEAVPRPDLIPDLELDPVRPVPEPPELVGTSAVVQPTDLAPSLSAAAALSEALPLEETNSEQAADMLEEVSSEREDEDRFRHEEEEEAENRRKKRASDRGEDDGEQDEPRPRRGPRKKGARRRSPPADRSPWPEGLTRNRALGALGMAVGGTILLGTLLHHLTASQSAWHYAVCCGDLFALALCGAGLFFLIKG